MGRSIPKTWENKFNLYTERRTKKTLRVVCCVQETSHSRYYTTSLSTDSNPYFNRGKGEFGSNCPSSRYRYGGTCAGQKRLEPSIRPGPD